MFDGGDVVGDVGDDANNASLQSTLYEIHDVDETGSDNQTVTTQGWSLRGEKSYSEQ